MDKGNQEQTNFSSQTKSTDPMKIHQVILLNPLPGDWFASAYIDSKDDRIQQKGLFKTCTTNLFASMSIKRLNFANSSKVTIAKVNHVTPITLTDKSHKLVKFTPPPNDSLRDKVTIRISNCSNGTDHLSKCPVKMYIRRFALPCIDDVGDAKCPTNDEYVDCELGNHPVCSFNPIEIAKAPAGQELPDYYLTIEPLVDPTSASSSSSNLSFHLSIHSIPNCTPITLTIPDLPLTAKQSDSSIVSTDTNDSATAVSFPPPLPTTFVATFTSTQVVDSIVTSSSSSPTPAPIDIVMVNGDLTRGKAMNSEGTRGNYPVESIVDNDFGMSTGPNEERRNRGPSNSPTEREISAGTSETSLDISSLSSLDSANLPKSPSSNGNELSNVPNGLESATGERATLRYPNDELFRESVLSSSNSEEEIIPNPVAEAEEESTSSLADLTEKAPTSTSTSTTTTTTSTTSTTTAASAAGESESDTSITEYGSQLPHNPYSASKADVEETSPSFNLEVNRQAEVPNPESSDLLPHPGSIASPKSEFLVMRPRTYSRRSRRHRGHSQLASASLYPYHSQVLRSMFFSDAYSAYHNNNNNKENNDDLPAHLALTGASHLVDDSLEAHHRDDISTFCPVNLHLSKYSDSQGSTCLKYVTNDDEKSKGGSNNNGPIRKFDLQQLVKLSANASMHNESLINIANSESNVTRVTLISFALDPLIDSGNMLTIELALSSKVNIREQNISAEACLSYERIPLDMSDCGKKISVNSSHYLTAGVITEGFTFLRVPFPSGGTYYLSLKASCYKGEGEYDLCHSNETLVRLLIKSSGCDQSCAKNGGKCQRYFNSGAPFLTWSQCICRNGYKGWSCEDSSNADSPEIQLRNFYLLVGSNGLLLPCALLALFKKCYIESLIYTWTMLSSALYHACDSGSGQAFCLVNLGVLQFADFYSALLSVWVTLISLGCLPEQVKSFLHMIGSILIVFLVEVDKTSLMSFAIPATLGAATTVLSWIIRCIRRSACYPSALLWCCSVLPGLVLASLALTLYALFETKENYAIIHSIWHGLMAMALFFLLLSFPKRGRKKGCCSKRSGIELTGSDTYYELIDEASHLTRTHKYSDSGPSTSTVLPP